MPWKKLYVKIRDHDDESYNHVKSLCCPVFIDTTQRSQDRAISQSIPIVNLIRYVILLITEILKSAHECFNCAVFSYSLQSYEVYKKQ